MRWPTVQPPQPSCLFTWGTATTARLHPPRTTVRAGIRYPSICDAARAAASGHGANKQATAVLPYITVLDLFTNTTCMYIVVAVATDHVAIFTLTVDCRTVGRLARPQDVAPLYISSLAPWKDAVTMVRTRNSARASFSSSPKRQNARPYHTSDEQVDEV